MIDRCRVLLLALCLLALPGAVRLMAQATAPTGVSAPTMEQTVEFIRDALVEQRLKALRGETYFEVRQTVKLDQPCLVALDYAQYSLSGQLLFNWRNKIHLDRSDPLSVRVGLSHSLPNLPKEYDVRATAVWAKVANDVKNPTQPMTLADVTSFAGIVQSVSETTLMVVSDKGELFKVDLEPTTEFQIGIKQSSGGFRMELGTVNAIHRGEEVTVEQQPSNDGRKAGPHSFRQIIQTFEEPSGSRDVGLGTFTDQDTANRVAKAYIHAMVLCRASGKPSLF